MSWQTREFGGGPERVDQEEKLRAVASVTIRRGRPDQTQPLLMPVDSRLENVLHITTTIGFEFWMHTQLLPCSGGSITIQTIWLSEQATTKMLLICEEAFFFWLDLMGNKCGAHSGCYGMDTIRDLYVLSPWRNSAKMSKMFRQSRRCSS